MNHGLKYKNVWSKIRRSKQTVDPKMTVFTAQKHIKPYKQV